MKQEFNASGEGLAITSPTLRPYGDSLSGLLAFLSALYMKFRRGDMAVWAVALLVTIILLAGSLWVMSGVMDGSKAVDPVNTAGLLYF